MSSFRFIFASAIMILALQSCGNDGDIIRGYRWVIK